LASLLARFADDAFWLARYVERADNLARILDVNEAFSRRGDAGDWLPIIQLHDDESPFFARYKKATADAVVHFYMLDRDNPGSIVSSIHMARENARALRHLISTEMWTHLNVFYGYLRGLRGHVGLASLSRVCTTIKENCQTHTGISEGTFYRDQAWCFYWAGKCVERADQTSRLLDMKYHHLKLSEETLGLPVEVSEWNALLRSVAGYHAFRRTHPHGMQPADVAAFLIFNSRFPRSIATCVHHCDELMRWLAEGEGLNLTEGLAAALGGLRDGIDSRDIDDVMGGGLHEFMDWVQRELIAVTDEMGRAFFGHGR